MGIFIGRRGALETLLSDLGGPASRTIASIHGLGGVGKTTLKAEVLLRLESEGAHVPYFHVDENASRGDLADFLCALADSLHQPWDGPAAEFGRLRRHRNRLRDLKGRFPDSPGTARLERGLQTALAGLARRVSPGITFQVTPPTHAPGPQWDRGAVVPAVLSTGTDQPGDDPGVWTRSDQADFETAVSAWTRDREDRELLLDPLAVLTRDFLDDLADYLFPPAPGLGGLLGGRRQLPANPVRALVVIDSYEALDQGVQEWLLVHLLPTYERHRFEGEPLAKVLDLRLLLCGRPALRDADPLRRWDVLADKIREIDLTHFDPSEIAAYLEARGLPAHLAAEAQQQTQGLPYLLALWCDSAGRDQALAVERAARRIYWWKTPEQIHWLKAAAFLDTLDRDALAITLADGSEEPAYAWLAANSELCVSDGHTLAIHPIVATLVREALSRESPAEATELTSRARLASRIAVLRRFETQPGAAELPCLPFGTLLDLAPLRWFDAEILRELGLESAVDAFSPLEPAPGTSFATVLLPGPNPGSLALAEPLRQDLVAYLKLVRPASYREAIDRIAQLDRRRRQDRQASLERSASAAQSLGRDASVARKRALSLDARVLALEAQEQAVTEAQKRAQAAADHLARLPARTPWWGAVATTAFATVAGLAARPLLPAGARPWDSLLATLAATAAFLLTIRALALPRSARPADHAAVRHDLDAAATRLAEIRADLSQTLVEASEAAREADALEARAAASEFEAEQPFVPVG